MSTHLQARVPFTEMQQMKAACFATGLLAGLSTAAAAEIQRTPFTTESDPGIDIAIREVLAEGGRTVGDPLILVHGARVPGVASFDLDVPGGSLAADLAARGVGVYIIDLRGYGASTRPAAMDAPPLATSPLVRSGAAVRDLAAAVEAVRQRAGADRVSILGWATGGHWAGQYAALYPETVSRLILYNTLYGYTPDHPAIGHGSRLSAPDDPDRFDIDRFRNYRLNPADSLLPGWDRSIPVDDKAAWRDPAIAQAYVDAALASDSTSADRQPPSFRAPSGALADSFLLANGAALWDARLTTADVLIVRSENDFWSRPQDADLLNAHLAARPLGSVSLVELPDATHFVHLDRPERGRDAFLQAVTTFLAGEAR